MSPDRHYTEAVVCNLVFSLRRLTRGAVSPVEVHFAHACPENLDEHRRILACPLVFGRAENGLARGGVHSVSSTGLRNQMSVLKVWYPIF
ncbi:MAG: AraC family transcriptional regulator ligand-binding domain-containing protein [Anaerolineae bacterium]|nr:AraC family transcriptional regulator ligand-binding domain-containing protein [Anaerolineae bacterium]